MNNGFFAGQGLPRGQILFGRIGDENPSYPGLYRFTSSDGISVNDARVLSADADNNGSGEATKPRPGSNCVAVMTTDGAMCFVIGFMTPPSFDQESDEAPVVGNAEDNNASGDKAYRTAGGAVLILKRGGAVIIEGGPGTGVIMNPLNNTMTLRATNFTQIVDGYQALRGRKEIGKTNPATVHHEQFLNQTGPQADRFSIHHGSLEDDARRQLELEAVTVAGGNETTITKTRETYYADGRWVGEGPKYQWGGEDASEPAVLGHALVDAISKLIDIVAQLKVGTAWGPSTPPLPPTTVDLAQLKAELSDKILSTFAFFSKKPPTL